MWEQGLQIILIAAVWFGAGVVTALAFGALVKAGRGGIEDSAERKALSIEVPDPNLGPQSSTLGANLGPQSSALKAQVQP